MGTQSAMRVNVGRSNLRMETFGFDFAEDAVSGGPPRTWYTW